MKRNLDNRADNALVNAGIAPTIEYARAYIMAGIIFYSLDDKEKSVEKAGMQIPKHAILFKREKKRYVSRGGYKLETALQYFTIPTHNAVCLDIGASTGGFTDCLLQYHAQRVYALDVGKHLLHEKLQKNERVIQKIINIKYLSKHDINEPLNIVVADISFISLEHIFTPITPLLANNAHLILLLKPQFELPKNYLRKGIVMDNSVYTQAIEKIVEHAKQFPLTYKGYVPSCIKGRKGNQEYLLYFTYNEYNIKTI